MKKTPLFASTLIAASFALSVSAWGKDLTWSGSVDYTWDTGTANWNGSTFSNGDNVTFNGSGAGTITISGAIEAGTMTVSTGNYTFSTSGSNTLTVNEIDMNGGSVTFDGSATIGTFYTAKDEGTDDTITLTTGTTLKVGTLTNNWGSNFVLNEGSVLETDSATFATYHTDTVTGSGTWKAGTFTFANWATSMFEGITLEVTDMVVGSNSQAAYITISGGTATIGTLSLNNSSSITFSNSGTYKVETVTNSGSGTISAGYGATVGITTITTPSSGSLTLTGEGTFEIGSYGNETTGATFAIGDGTTVNMGTFSLDWHQNTTTLGDGAVWNVTTELALHTANTEEFTGGTINAEKLWIYNGATGSFSNGTLNIGSGGIVNTNNWGSYEVAFGDGLTVGVYAGTSGANTSWSTTVEIHFTGTYNSGTTFYTEEDQTITLGGGISGVGFTNTGDGTLILSGDIALSSAIINSGNITISDGTSFVLDNLTAGHVEGTLIGYYEIVTSSGGSITYAEGGTYTFVHNGTTLSDWNIYVDENGNVYAYGESGEFTWNGTNTNNNWSTSHEDQPWLVGGTDSSYFVNGSDVTFGTDAAYKIVNITEGVTAGTIAVNDNYTFVFADGIKVEASYVDVASGKTLTLQLTEGATSAEFHMDGETWYQFFSNANSRENHGTVEIGAGVTFYLSDSTETATIGSANYGALITGTGTLSVGTTGAMGLYLPEFQGTVIFREGTTIRIGHDNDNYGDTGIYGASSTLVFESGSGITLISNLSNWTTTDGDYRVTAALVFEAGSHTIATAGYTAEFSGAISGADATIAISGAGNLTFSGSVDIGTVTISDASTNTFSGGGTIGTVTINAGATLVFSGDSKTYTITTITKSGSNTAGTLEVDAGATVNVGTLNGDWYVGTIKVDGVLNISGTVEFGSGSGNTETFTGTGTVTVGTLQVGHSSNSSNGATVKIDGGLTFITGAITTGVITNNSHLQLGNTTFGTSSSTGLTFASTITEVTLTASGNEKTTFNTNVYDVAAGEFTTNGTTITIGVSVVGGGDIAVTGNGTLALSGTSTLGSVTVDSGATLDLSSGTVTVGSSIQNSGTVVVNSDTLFVLDNLSGTTDSGGTTYVIISGGGSITGWDTLDASNFSISGSTITSVTVTTEGQVTIVAEAITGLIWDGGTGNWNTSETNWTESGSSATFTAGSDVWFERSGSGTVTVQEGGVTAGSVTVTGGTYSFAGGSITLTGTFTINRGAEVDLNSGNSTIYGNFVVEGTLKLAGSGGSSGEIHGTITINNGGWVELDVGDATGYSDGGGVTKITINKGGELYVGTTSNQTLGSCELILVGGTVDGVSGSNIDLYLNSKITVLAEEGADADNPTVSIVKGAMLTPRKSNSGGTTEVFVDANAVLDVQSGFWSGPGGDSSYNGNIEKTGAGTLEVSGYFAINNGSLIIDAGTVILSGYAGGTSNSYGFASSVSVASGALLNMCFAEDTSISGTTFSGAGTIEKSGEYKLTIDGYTFGGTTTVSEGTLVLTGSTEVIDVHVANGATLDLTRASKAGNDGNGSLYIDGEGSTVKIATMTWGSGSNFGANMNNCYLQISNGGVLEVTATQAADTAGRRGFAIMEGEGTYRYSGEDTSYIAANETNQNIHVADGATLIFDVVISDATLEVSKLIANSYNDSNGEGTTTSSGSLVKIGAGTVILSNESNLYSGGTTIKEGVLVAASSGALGTGTVSIDGGQLEISNGVTITNNIEVTLSETYLVMDPSISPTSLGSGQIEPYAAGAEGDGIYAITGTGSLGSSESQVTITLFIDDTIAELLAEAGETGLGFYLLDEYNISTESSFTVSLSDALSGYTATYDSNTGIVWIVGAAAPEPELFSVFFGISALGMIATRRRRRRTA